MGNWGHMRFAVFALAVFFVSSPAHAHFFIEPGFGYEFGSSKTTLVSANMPTVTTDSSPSGPTYSFAGGYRYQRYFVGAQLEKCLGGRVTDFSAFAGYNFALRLKLYGSLIFRTTDDISRGTGWKLGLGYAIWKLFGINFEYASRSFGKYTGDATYTNVTYTGTTNTFKILITLTGPRQPF